jgi:hypothetical protein
MSRYLVASLLILNLLSPVDADAGMFNPAAWIDATQVVTHPGVWLCPGELEGTKCTVDLIPASATRPDWDEALAACLQYYTPTDCYNSVSDGEF